MTGERQCAMWYSAYGKPCFWLADDEEDAAESAVAVENSDECGTVLGVQFADGHLVKAGDWEAYHRERRESDERTRAVAEHYRVTPMVKTVLRDPFNGEECTVTSESPGWPPVWVGARA